MKKRRSMTTGPKRRNAPKAVRRRSSSPAGRETKLARLTRELHEAAEQQTATSDVLKVIASSPGDLAPVFDALVERAMRLCEAAYGHVYTFDGELFHLAVAHGERRYLDWIRQSGPRPPTSSLTFLRIVAGESVAHIGDITAEPSYRSSKSRARTIVAEFGIRTVLTVALRKEDTLLGTIVLYRQDARPFSDKQIALVTNFASQAVIAIENTRLLSELRQRTTDLGEALEQQTATSEVLRVISSSPGDLELVFQAMLANATRLCAAKFGNLYLCEGDAFRTTAMYNVPLAFAEVRRREPLVHPRPGSLLARLTSSKRAVHIPDATADQGYIERQPMFVTAVELGGFRALLAVPMLKDGNLIGAIVIYRQNAGTFSNKQIDLVQNFAAQAVIAIENTRLLNELRQRTDDLSESLEQQTATSEVLQVISSSPGELEPVFQALLENAVRICGAAFGNLLLNEGDAFRRVAMYNAPQTAVDAHRRNPTISLRSAPVLDRLVRTRQIIHLANVAAEYPDEPIIKTAGARTLLVVPMLKENELIGAIGIYRHEVRPFTDKQIKLVENFAAQAVIAIENTRLLRELRESLQQQTATADVLKVISRSTFDLRTVLQTLVESAARFCDADKATIIREKDGAFYSAEAYGYSREFMDYIKNIPIEADRGSASGRALLDGRVVHIPDVQADPEYALADAQRLGDYRTTLCVPMLREGVPIGVLALTRSEVRPFTEKQIELVTTFADQAAIAIENVRLFESVEARTRELAKSLEDLRTAQDRLVQTEKLASLGQLTAGIAHEIKNPLNFVNNFSAISVELIDELRQALAGANLDNKLRAQISEIADTLQGNLDKVVQHGKRADAIVKNMLLHSRQGSGEHRPIDINALVEESLNLAYHGARAEKQGFNITLERSFDPTAGEADVFPQEITRVLLNLISNGFYAATKRKAETNGGNYEPTLAAATKNLGDSVEIRIRDNGTGIPPEVKEKMFNPFFTTKPVGEGTGLGLSLSHDIIVKQHAGSIEVDTQPGVFTEFRIVLPRGAATIAKSGERR